MTGCERKSGKWGLVFRPSEAECCRERICKRAGRCDKSTRWAIGWEFRSDSGMRTPGRQQPLQVRPGCVAFPEFATPLSTVDPGLTPACGCDAAADTTKRRSLAGAVRGSGRLNNEGTAAAGIERGADKLIHAVNGGGILRSGVGREPRGQM